MKTGTLTPAALLMAILMTAAPSAVSATNRFCSPVPVGPSCTQAAPCSLNQAVTLADAGDTIYLATGSYTAPALATSVVSVDKSLRFLGGWDGTTTAPPVRAVNSLLTVLDGEATVPVVGVQGPGVAVTFDTLSIYRGLATDRGGGIAAVNADLTLRTVFVYKNRVVATAANNMDFGGGGVYVTGGKLQVFSSVLTGNWAVNTNGYQTYGGAILLNNAAQAAVNGSIINNNDAVVGSGIGMRTQDGAETPLTVNSTWFVSNGRGNSGGTTGKYGGGLDLERSVATIFGCLLQDNAVSDFGGAIHASEGDLHMDRSTVINNAAGDRAIVYIASGNARLRNNIIADNDSGSDPEAAAVYLLRPNITMTLIHNTIVGRSASPRGAAVATDNDAKAILVNNIIARFDTGAYAWSYGQITLKGTLWGTGAWANGANTATGGFGAIITLGPGNISGDPAFLDPAVFGPYHIGALSAARNKGLATTLTVDHDGKPRDASPDIGADEYIAKVLLLTPNGGQKLTEGFSYAITWGAPGKAVKFKLHYSLDGGTHWKLIDGDVGRLYRLWTLPQVAATRHNCLIRVKSYTAAWKFLGADVSDAPFTIRNMP